MDDFKHNVPLLGGGQATFQQCWYASYGMLLRYHKRNPAEIEAKLSGAGISFDRAMADGLSDTEFKRASESLGLRKWGGEPFKAGGGFWDIGLTDGAEAFLRELQISPLWVSRYIQKGTYHITLAVGYEDTSKGHIIYNNPYPGKKDAVEERMPANVYVRDITYAMGSVQAVR
jgi:hypothetical protein